MENHTECADCEKGNETVQLLKVIVHKTAGEYVPYQFPLHFNQKQGATFLGYSDRR